MVEPQASRFWQAAIRSGLLDDAALQKAWDLIPAEKRTADAIDRRLARQLVNAGGLSLWQAQQILAGRWQGMKIDKYILLDVIGQGGMGRVYLARDTRLGRLVALKILSKERMNNPRALTRFRREAKVGAQLQHENLVRIYDEGEAHGVRYLVMEYIEGKTVGHLIAETGRLEVTTAADLARQVARGLEHLHQKGLLHRDVNPMNILVDHHGTAKLTDLGLAIDLSDLDDIVTRDGATVGTFDYISPEQARHSRSADGRSDIYSLGCSLYQMLSGQVPFPMPSLPEKLYAHQARDPEPLASLIPGFPEGLQQVVLKMMRKDPADRYARPLDVARALEPFSRSATIPALAHEEAGVPAPGMNGVAHVPSGPAPTGSDPELESGRRPDGGSTTSPGTPTSGPLDFMPRIDLGPEPPLSRSRSGPRDAKKKATPRTGEETGPKVPWLIWLAASIGGVIVLAGVIGGGILLVKKKPWAALLHSSRPVEPDAPVDVPRPSAAGTPEIAIRDPDGTETPQASLREAIQRVVGRPSAEIVVKTSKLIRAGDSKASLAIPSGNLVIRAAGGAKPELLVELSNKLPWIEVGPQAKLTLIGLKIQADVTRIDEQSKDVPTLVKSAGNVAIDRCHFVTTSSDRSTSVLSGEGLDTQISGTVLEGFNRPLSLRFYPGSSARLSHCLFVRDVISDPLAGWAVAALRENSRNPAKTRRLTFDRCTVLGAGLLVAEKFSEDGPLEVSVRDSALKLSALLMTAGNKADVPKAIHWLGQNNHYAISGASWISLAPGGFDAMAGAPVDLKSWSDLMGHDAGGRDDILGFLGGPSPAEGRPPSEFAPTVEKDKPPVGADPARIAPEAKDDRK